MKTPEVVLYMMYGCMACKEFYKTHWPKIASHLFDNGISYNVIDNPGTYEPIDGIDRVPLIIVSGVRLIAYPDPDKIIEIIDRILRDPGSFKQEIHPSTKPVRSFSNINKVEQSVLKYLSLA